MSTYSPVAGKSLIAALQRAGFLIQRVKGSHHFLRHPDGREPREIERLVSMKRSMLLKAWEEFHG